MTNSRSFLGKKSVYVFLVIVILLSVTSCNFSKKSKDNDLAKFNLKGKVIGVEQRTYLVDEENDYLDEANELGSWRQVSDNYAINVYRKNFYYVRVGVLFFQVHNGSSFKIRFNKNGNIENADYGNSREYLKLTRQYDEMQRIIEEKLGNKNNEDIQTIKYLYNEENQLKKTKWYYEGKDEPTYTITFGYDNVGKLITETSQKSYSEEVNKINYGYNEAGRVNMAKTIEKGKLQEWDYTRELQYQFEYDNHGNIAKLKIIENYTETCDDNCYDSYKENDKPNFREYKHSRDIVWTYEYKYDKNGNWGKRIEKGKIVKATSQPWDSNNSDDFTSKWAKEGSALTLVTTRKVEYR